MRSLAILAQIDHYLTLRGEALVQWKSRKGKWSEGRMFIWCRLAHRRYRRDRIQGFLFVCDKCGREWRDPNGPPICADDICDDTLIPVFVINLKESVSRREHMKREMAKAKIPFTFIDAISGNEITATIGTVTRNETACALSHLHAIRLIAEGKEEFGAIFEDDIILSPDAKLFLDNRVLRTLPRFDIMQLMFMMKRQGLAINIAKVSRKYNICVRPRPSLGTQALIYRKSAAQRIVREITEISSQIDIVLFRNNDVFGLRIVSVRPAVVMPGDFQTTIFAPQIPDLRNKIRRELARAMTYLRLRASFVVAWIGK